MDPSALSGPVATPPVEPAPPPSAPASPPAPPTPPVAPPPPSGSRLPPLGAVIAAVALVGSIALIALAVAGVPPFTSSESPSPVATAAPTPPATPSESVVPSSSPTTSPLSSADIEAQLTAIEQRMTQIRELSATTSVPGKLVTTAEASKILVDDFHTENPKQIVDDTTALYRALGLLNAEQDLGKLFDRFLSTQVLGFYRDTDKDLYIVSDQGFGPLEKFTASHEYTHALQDQHFDLKKISPDAFDQSDRQIARTSLIEGDAVLAMTQWAQSELSPEEISQLIQQLQDPAAEQALAGMPPIVRETQEFPYSQGLQFVQSFWAKGGWSAVDDVWKNPPDSVEQVLHAEKYASHEKPIPVALPSDLAAKLGAGWSLALQDTAGELITRIWLEEAGDTAAGTTAAAGWGGDRMGLYEGPAGAWAVVWLTQWDSTTDAGEFATAAGRVAAQLPNAGVFATHGGSYVLVASDSTLLRKLASELGL